MLAPAPPSQKSLFLSPHLAALLTIAPDTTNGIRYDKHKNAYVNMAEGTAMVRRNDDGQFELAWSDSGQPVIWSSRYRKQRSGVARSAARCKRTIADQPPPPRSRQPGQANDHVWRLNRTLPGRLLLCHLPATGMPGEAP